MATGSPVSGPPRSPLDAAMAGEGRLPDKSRLCWARGLAELVDDDKAAASPRCPGPAVRQSELHRPTQGESRLKSEPFQGALAPLRALAALVQNSDMWEMLLRQHTVMSTPHKGLYAAHREKGYHSFSSNRNQRGVITIVRETVNSSREVLPPVAYATCIYQFEAIPEEK
ncbi:uncharacterized protein LOC119851728 [Dermochelys coriacea]|uniref:uncharacterized protein LOC119851728 n=1 Tax=Dermochelys coriacea TaxID=27794 RepID=UPI001CA9BA6B|nr:uncharacterized protein LOC119851728 [Dermochelys coriacea]